MFLIARLLAEEIQFTAEPHHVQQPGLAAACLAADVRLPAGGVAGQQDSGPGPSDK